MKNRHLFRVSVKPKTSSEFASTPCHFTRNRLLLAAFLLFSPLMTPSSAWAAKCLWVNSYAPGYEWSDGIGEALHETLANGCQLDVFHMDTKSNPDPEFARQQAQKVLEQLRREQPDVIIASDDNASRYLVLPHLKDGLIPVVFCGINWSVERYGYPFRNTTGMIEVSPVAPLIKEIKRSVNEVRRGLFISTPGETTQVDQHWFKMLFAAEGLTVQARYVNSMDEWVQAFREGQQHDFLVLGNYGAIKDWDKERAKAVVRKHGTRLTVSNDLWMSPYTMLITTKMPQEQGEWAGKVAIEILKGTKPKDIPIVPNRRWNTFINRELLESAGINLSPELMLKAVEVEP